MFLELINISKSYKIKDKKIEVLKNINFKIKKKDFLCLKGQSGSGKTTFLNIIGGLTKIDSGIIKLKEQVINKSVNKKLSYFRRENIGFVFQQFNLISYHTVLENISIPLKFSSIPFTRHKKIAREFLKEFGLLDKENHYPEMLSGGQMQRVAIARALVKKPKLIIADEPTANLDESNANDIIKLLIRLNEEHQISFLIATHYKPLMQKSNKLYQLKNKNVSLLDDLDN